ncbi:MAG: type 4a pilus biogenesis protein PilO [Porticoccaceae bacterium]|nr:type 4a pilus biogenesis protein PilO [Porticoccaceae bacterium]
MDSFLGFDLNKISRNGDFSPSQIESWTNAIFGFVLAAAFGLILLLGYSFFVHDIIEKTVAETTIRETKIMEFESEYELISGRDKYLSQMSELDTMFAALAAKMPPESEVAEVIEDISKVAADYGLSTSSVSPKAELKQNLYVELPINISVVGTYHSLGDFVAGISQLTRLVTLHNFSVNLENKGSLVMKMEAKTYKFVGEVSNDE